MLICGLKLDLYPVWNWTAEASNGGQVFASYNRRTKARGLGHTKNVPIGYLAKDVDARLGASDNLVYLISDKKPPGRAISSEDLGWMYDKPASGWIGQVWKREIIWQREGENINNCRMRDVSGRSVAIVGNFVSDIGPNGCGETLNKVRLDGNIGTQLSPCCIFYPLNQLSGSSPKFTIINNQSGRNENQETIKYRKKKIENNEFPIIRRSLLAVFSALLGLDLCLFGWDNFDGERRVLGAALLGLGGLVAFAGLGLVWLTQFTWSWGWLL